MTVPGIWFVDIWFHGHRDDLCYYDMTVPGIGLLTSGFTDREMISAIMT